MAGTLRRVDVLRTPEERFAALPGLDHPVLEGAGHFLQEDAGRQLGEIVADFVAGGPVRRCR